MALRELDFDPFAPEKENEPLKLRELDFDPFAPEPARPSALSTLTKQNASMSESDYEEADRSRSPTGGAAIDVARSIPAGAVKGIGMGVSGLGTLYQATGRSLYRPFEMALRAGGLDDVADAFNTPAPWWMDPGAAAKGVGEGIKSVGDTIGVPDERQNIATGIGEGLGQIAGQLTAAILSGGASSVTSTGLLLGQGVDQMEDMRKENAPNRQDALTDSALIAGGGITALLEQTGLDNLLERIPPNIKNGALRQLADIGIAGGIEAAQEVAEGVLQRLTAMATFAPDMKLFEETPEEAAVGGSVGAIARGLLNIAMPGRLDTKTDRVARTFRDMVDDAEFDQDGASIAVRQMDPRQAQQILSPEELEAEIPNDLLIEGKQAQIDVGQEGAFEELLTEANMPGIGARVKVDFGDGRIESGEILGGFDAGDNELGLSGKGVSLKLDNGQQIDELVATLQSIGVKITPEIQNQVEAAVQAADVQPGGGVLPAGVGQAAPGSIPSSPGVASQPIGAAEAVVSAPDGPVEGDAAPVPIGAAPTFKPGDVVTVRGAGPVELQVKRVEGANIILGDDTGWESTVQAANVLPVGGPTAPVQGQPAPGSQTAGTGETATGAQISGEETAATAGGTAEPGGQGAAVESPNASPAPKVPSVSEARANELAQQIAAKLKGEPVDWTARGKADFEAGKNSTPPGDVRAAGGDALDKWTKAWHSANVAAPVPGVTPRKEDETAPKEPAPLMRRDGKPYPTAEAAKSVAKGKAFRKQYGRGWIPTKVEGGFGLKQRKSVRGAQTKGKVNAADGHDMLTVIASHGGISDTTGDDVKAFQKTIQGRGALVRTGGMDWDTLELFLVEQGFYDERPGWDVMKRDLQLARKKPRYLPQLQGEIEEEGRADQDAIEEAEVRAEIQAIGDRDDMLFSESDVKAILGLMGDRGLGVQAAIDAFVDGSFVDDVVDAAQEANDLGILDELTWEDAFEPAEGRGAGAQVEPGQTPKAADSGENGAARAPPEGSGLKLAHDPDDVARIQNLADELEEYYRANLDGREPNRGDYTSRYNYDSAIDIYRNEHGDKLADDMDRLGAQARRLDAEIEARDEPEIKRRLEQARQSKRDEKDRAKSAKREAEESAFKKALESSPTTMAEWVDHLAAKLKDAGDKVFSFKSYGGQERQPGYAFGRSPRHDALIASIQGRRKRLRPKAMDDLAKQLGTVRLKKIRDLEKAAKAPAPAVDQAQRQQFMVEVSRASGRRRLVMLEGKPGETRYDPILNVLFIASDVQQTPQMAARIGALVPAEVNADWRSEKIMVTTDGEPVEIDAGDAASSIRRRLIQLAKLAECLKK